MRQAAKHQRAPGGLLLPMRATLKGRIRWQVLDERGVPEVPRSPSGFPLAPAEGVEQPNLITDLGLDQIAAYDCFGVDPASSTTWRRYLAVGTGSSAPANGDTTLDAEVQRAASSGSFSNGATTYELDDSDDVWRATSLVTRLVTMSADRNVTEFGLSPVASGDIGIRELLRDGGGNPVTISLLNGKTLRVDHTLVVELPAPESGHSATLNIAEYDVGNNLVGTTPYDIVHGGFVRADSPEQNTVGALFEVWKPNLTNQGGTSANTGLRLPLPDQASGYKRKVAFTNTTGVSNLVAEAYVSGSFQRTKRATAAAASLNTSWGGFIWTTVPGSGGAFGGWHVHFVDPPTYTKVDTDTLRVGFISSWARA